MYYADAPAIAALHRRLPPLPKAAPKPKPAHPAGESGPAPAPAPAAAPSSQPM